MKFNPNLHCFYNNFAQIKARLNTTLLKTCLPSLTTIVTSCKIMKSCLFCGKSLNSSSKTLTKIYNTSFPHSHHKLAFFIVQQDVKKMLLMTHKIALWNDKFNVLFVYHKLQIFNKLISQENHNRKKKTYVKKFITSVKLYSFFCHNNEPLRPQTPKNQALTFLKQFNHNS